MSLQNLKTISSLIPKAERDLPVVIYESQGYSIYNIIAEVESETTLGKELQKLPIMESSKELAKQRLITQFSKHPELKFGTFSLEKQAYTAAELIEEIKYETEVGMWWINTQLKRIENIRARWR